MVKIVKTGKEIAEVFNDFFGNIIKNLNISQYTDFNPIIERVKDSTLKAILKYESTLAFWRSEVNVIGVVLLVLRRSVLRKFKQKLGY